MMPLLLAVNSFDGAVAVFVQPFIVAFARLVGVFNGVQQAVGIRRIPENPHPERRFQRDGGRIGNVHAFIGDGVPVEAVAKDGVVDEVG